jgi:hypothetical protein
MDKHRKSAILRENAVVAWKFGKLLSVTLKFLIWGFVDSAGLERCKALPGPAKIWCLCGLERARFEF